MSEKTIKTVDDLRAVLDKVTFRESCVNLDWKWEVTGVLNGDGDLLGWLVRTSFTRPDTNTGLVDRGSGRWELVKKGTTVSGVVKTCWLLAELIVRHELMEAFQYDGVKIFDPHHTVEELSMPHWRKSRR